MSKIRIESIAVENYRSFKERQTFIFPDKDYKKPVAIVGYNNSGKTNLLNSILYGLQVNFVSKDTFSKDDFHNRDMNNIPFILLKATSSIETKFDGEMCRVQLPIPDIKIQEAIVTTIYHTLEARKRINEQLKDNIKPLCPVLMRGVLERLKFQKT